MRHPWLLINISRDNYGNPLSYKSMQSIWNKLLERLNKRYGIDLSARGVCWHSLRHFYGWYCASCLGMDLSTTKAMMHHSSEESTACYFRISGDVARNRINEAALKQLGFKKEDIDLLIAPGTPKINWPTEWISRQLKIKMLALNSQNLLK